MCWIFDYNFRANQCSLFSMRTNLTNELRPFCDCRSPRRSPLLWQCLSTTKSLLNHIDLPVAVLPAFIAFPENCKHKHRTERPFGGWKICEPKIQFVLVCCLRLVSPLPIIRRPCDARLLGEDDPQYFAARHPPYGVAKRPNLKTIRCWIHNVSPVRRIDAREANAVVVAPDK